MDSVYFAVAAVAMLVMGVAFVIAGIAVFAFAFIRWELWPRFRAIVAVVAAHTGEWLAPPDPAWKPRRL